MNPVRSRDRGINGTVYLYEKSLQQIKTLRVADRDLLLTG